MPGYSGEVDKLSVTQSW